MWPFGNKNKKKKNQQPKPKPKKYEPHNNNNVNLSYLSQWGGGATKKSTDYEGEKFTSPASSVSQTNTSSEHPKIKKFS